VTIDPAQYGLKQYEMKTSTVVFMVFCLCAAGAYGIEEMIPQAGPGLTLVMLIVLPFLWSTPMGLVAAELGSALPQEGGFYKWVQRACGEFWGFQAGWWRTISIYFDNTLYVHRLHLHQYPGYPGSGSGKHHSFHPGADGLRPGCRGWLRNMADKSLRSFHSAGSISAAEYRIRAGHRDVGVLRL
jgi:hypothetical protein